jgi:2',3'-cyclic-nucleotide 2'-phosphodiesterase (5'-nucleotidase family)
VAASASASLSPNRAAATPDIVADALSRELPFGNRLVTLSVSGAVLTAAIENGLSKLPNPSGRFPQVSGLSVEADVSRPPGSRVISVKVGDAPLDPARTYTVASAAATTT